MLRLPLSLAALLIVALSAVLAVSAQGDTEVTVGSNDFIFSQNKQNEPAIAIDANHPNIVVAGANDNIDMEACNAGDPTTCPFTPGVGVSGVYFSFDNGATWTQPTYTGWSARACVGPPGFKCTPAVGSIGTLPWYFENGLKSDGDPAVAFGPKPDSGGHFSWANGSRLYYANLTANFSALRSEEAFPGFEALAVSRTDNVQAAAAGDKSAWMAPVIVSKQNSTLFSDKEQIWADNASSSPFFGNVYVCGGAFRSQEKGHALPEPLMVSTSHDGGNTWASHQITNAATNVNQGNRSGCTVRTDSHGVVYVVYTHFAAGTPGIGTHEMVRSFDGGLTWTRPQVLYTINDACFNIDPIIGRCVEDGIAGARNDLTAGTSVSIANGAPTGAGATNEIMVTWADGRAGLNHEQVMLSRSSDRGGHFTAPVAVSMTGDRGYYSAIALSPTGGDAYLVYNAFTTPYRTDTTSPRTLVGVLLHSDINASGLPTGWSEVHRGQPGDPRGTSQNNLQAEFLGDYVYAAATDTYGVAVWNDARNAGDCPAMDAWRMTARTKIGRPAPQQDCPSTFGNSDIFGISMPDPTP